MRNPGLDFMRALAILLVLCRHAAWDGFLHDIGWIGVDLFFVLSGFLISGLIFREFDKTGSFNLKRFFIRRGLKIYPGFYFFFFVTLLLNYAEHGLHYTSDLILSEVFFLQSYLPHIWGHTWSIAVEEHFYLVIGLAATAAASWKFLSRLTAGIYILAGLMLMWTMRFIVVWPLRHADEISITATHIRADGILVGVALAWLVYKRAFRLRQANYYIIPGLMLAASVVYFKDNDFMMSVLGLPMMHFGFALLILVAWQAGNDGMLRGRIVEPFLRIGEYSYAIYLWHLYALQELYRFQLSEGLYVIAYIALSLIMGVVATHLIEKPVLKLRDRFAA